MGIDFTDNSMMFPGSNFMTFMLLVDEKLIETNRVVYNIFDALSNTGGFASVITLVFTILTLKI